MSDGLSFDLSLFNPFHGLIGGREAGALSSLLVPSFLSGPFPAARCVGAARPQPLIGCWTLLTEGGTGRQQAAIVLRNDGGEEPVYLPLKL